MGPVKKEVFEDFPVDTDPDRFFKAWMDHPVIAPKIFSDRVEKAFCSKGNHLEQGGVVELVYPAGRALFTKEYTSGRDVLQHTLVDYKRRVHKYEFLKGELLDRCKFYRGTLAVVPAEYGTKCIVKREVEFDIKDDGGAPFTSAYHERAAQVYYHRIEQYLNANPAEYT